MAFDGTAATFSFVSPTQITATVPFGALTGPVAVTTPSGTGTSPTAFRVVPTVSSFTPTSGPPGTRVTITGSAFTGARKVLFNGTTAFGNFTVDSYTQITVLVPLQATTGPIAVVTAGGKGKSTTSFTVTSSYAAGRPT